jgi:catechol 2,3-dioxygenase-like lactoylglutathione lyase family enzyme
LVKRFDNAGIAVRDIDIMETFYRDVLGAQILPLEGFLGEGTHSFDMFLGGVAFFVFQTGNPAQHGRTIENVLSNGPGYDHLVFEVGDIAAAQTWLESQGIAAGLIEDITIPGLGAFQYLRFKDPEGNLLGLRQPVTKE